MAAELSNNFSHTQLPQRELSGTSHMESDGKNQDLEQEKLHQAVRAFSKVSSEHPAVIGRQAVALELACIRGEYPVFSSAYDVLRYIQLRESALQMIAQAADSRHASSNKARENNRQPQLKVSSEMTSKSVKQIIESEMELLQLIKQGCKKSGTDYVQEIERIFSLKDRQPEGMEWRDIEERIVEGFARPYFDPVRIEIERLYQPLGYDPDEY